MYYILISPGIDLDTFMESTPKITYCRVDSDRITGLCFRINLISKEKNKPDCC